MKTKKTYTLLCSGPLMNGSMLQELVCEGYDPDRARARAKQRLDDEFKGDLFSMKMAAQFQPSSVEYTYYSAEGIELDDLDPKTLTQNKMKEICEPIAAEMGWSAAYIELFEKVCVVLPKNPGETYTPGGFYGFIDYRNDAL